jgi:hypothetical protein
MFDWTLMLEWAPTLIMVLLAVWATWFVWRLLKRLFRFAGDKTESAPVSSRAYPAQERKEPVLGPVASSASTIPDAADVLALKASIDALTRQIASLEKRLAPPSAVQAAAPPLPNTRSGDVIPMPIEPVVSPERRKG